MGSLAEIAEVTQTISARYFAGQDLLFPSVRESLDSLEMAAGMIVKESGGIVIAVPGGFLWS